MVTFFEYSPGLLTSDEHQKGGDDTCGVYENTSVSNFYNFRNVSDAVCKAFLGYQF
jgi:hypothetical protein